LPVSAPRPGRRTCFSCERLLYLTPQTMSKTQKYAPNAVGGPVSDSFTGLPSGGATADPQTASDSRSPTRISQSPSDFPAPSSQLTAP
jgi:hypothetical protein